MSTLSPALARAYGRLFTRFEGGAFTFAQGGPVLGGTLAARSMTLSRLSRRGWLVRVGPGSFVVLRPLAPLSEVMTDWPSRVRPRALHDVVRCVLSGLDGALGDRLLAVALFGSRARGTARPESDLDLLVVARGPWPFEERRRVESEVARACTGVVLREWRAHGSHPVPNLVILPPEELERGSSFLLDLAREAIPLYDRGGGLAKALGALALRAERLGVRRVELSAGRWYWVTPRGTSWAALSIPP